MKTFILLLISIMIELERWRGNRVNVVRYEHVYEVLSTMGSK